MSEVSKLFESDVETLLMICLLGGLQALIRGFGLIGGGISIHNTNVVNTVHPLRPKVSDEEIPLEMSFVL